MENSSWVLDGLKHVGPELAMVGTLVVVIFADLTRFRRSAAFFAVAGLAVASWLVCRHLKEQPHQVFQRAYSVDAYANYFKLLFLTAGLIVSLFSIPAIKDWTSGKGEFFALLVSCTFGMMLMAGANDLLMMYLSLEFVSITSYILAGFLRKNRKSAEASLKYIIYGAAASGFMIYGMTFLYGLTGTLNVHDIGIQLQQVSPQPTLTLITSVLIMAGLGYQ